MVLSVAGLVAAFPLYVPEALAFPHHAVVRGASILSDAPIPPAIDGVIARADVLVAASPLATVPTGRRVFLTDGGWRWHWLALTSSGAFGLSRPLSEAVLVNRSDVAQDRVVNGAAIGGERTLSGTIAHERTHTLIRARYGQVVAAMLPLWLREGYPDYVAHESSLSDAQVAALHRAGVTTPAIAYHDARLRVAATLKADGGSVERLFDAR